MKIANFDTDKKIFVVAEVGNCHEGSLDLAEEMISLAAKAGADAVKFQTIVPERLVASSEKDRIQQLKKLCLTYEHFQKLHKTAARENIIFMSTPFDLESVRFLEPLVPAFKIASGDNNFTQLLTAVAETGKPVIFSCGAAESREVEDTITLIQKVWKRKNISQELAVLHCVVSYPAEPQHAHLNVINTLKQFGVTVGYSDHVIGIEAPVLAAALGARIVEKHFTVRNDYSEFRDHKLAANPADFKEMVERIRRAEILLGSPEKKVLPPEIDNRARVRRSLALVRPLAKGAQIKSEDLTCLRPATGFSPAEEPMVLGKKAARDLPAGEILKKEDLS